MMISDNAKTFKAAAEKAPWWGGIFERMIQTAKRCLRKTIGRACLIYEELLTIVIEVEMTLNSRPLSYITSDDLEEPLTPSHLLCSHRVLSLVSGKGGTQDCSATRNDLTRRMQYLSKILTDFWKRWQSEYLLELRDMHRHFRTARGVDSDICIGDVVIIHDENLPRGLWRLGTVEELMIGADSNVRSAVVRITSRSRGPHSIKRPIQRLYPLEICSADETLGAQNSQADCEMPQNTSGQHRDANMTRKTVMESKRPRRQAFKRAQDRIQAWCKDF